MSTKIFIFRGAAAPSSFSFVSSGVALRLLLLLSLISLVRTTVPTQASIAPQHGGVSVQKENFPSNCEDEDGITDPDQLPIEIAKSIFSFVTPLDTGRSRRVSQGWKSKLSTLMSQYDLLKGFPRDVLNDETFQTLIEQLPEIVHLNISHQPQVSNISALASRCSELKSLDLTGTSVTDISPLRSCSKLTSLKLIGLQGLRDISYLSSCSELEFLDLSRSGVTNISALSSCSMLKSLDLSGTRVSTISALGSCSNLENLRLLNCIWVSSISPLKSCSKLKDLNLFRTNVSNISDLQSCSELEHLNLHQTRVSDTSALNSCSKLDIRGPTPRLSRS